MRRFMWRCSQNEKMLIVNKLSTCIREYLANTNATDKQIAAFQRIEKGAVVSRVNDK